MGIFPISLPTFSQIKIFCCFRLFSTLFLAYKTCVLRLNMSDHETNKTKKSSRLPMRVTFTNVLIREYDITLGDHPECPRGPPVSLSWDFEQSPSIPLEHYESNRYPRRIHGDLVMSDKERKFILLNAGFSKRDIIQATKEVKRIKTLRQYTNTFGSYF